MSTLDEIRTRAATLGEHASEGSPERDRYVLLKMVGGLIEERDQARDVARGLATEMQEFIAKANEGLGESSR